jgi:hypothetical protein
MRIFVTSTHVFATDAALRYGPRRRFLYVDSTVHKSEDGKFPVWSVAADSAAAQ